MTEEYRKEAFENARKERDAARAKMNQFKAGSKEWNETEEELNFWQSKVAFLAVPVK